MIQPKNRKFFNFFKLGSNKKIFGTTSSEKKFLPGYQQLKISINRYKIEFMCILLSLNRRIFLFCNTIHFGIQRCEVLFMLAENSIIVCQTIIISDYRFSNTIEFLYCLDQIRKKHEWSLQPSFWLRIE